MYTDDIYMTEKLDTERSIGYNAHLLKENTIEKHSVVQPLIKNYIMTVFFIRSKPK